MIGNAIRTQPNSHQQWLNYSAVGGGTHRAGNGFEKPRFLGFQKTLKPQKSKI